MYVGVLQGMQAVHEWVEGVISKERHQLLDY